MLGFTVWLDRFVERRSDDEVDLLARRTIALAESRIGVVLDALDALKAGGAGSCRPASLEVLRQATFTTTPIKEISVVAGDGRTLCVDYGSPFEQRIPAGKPAEPAGGALIEIVRVGDRPGHMVRIRRPAEGGETSLAALVPPDLFIAQVSTRGGPNGSHARMVTGVGTVIGEHGTLSPAAEADAGIARTTRTSQLYGLSVTLSLPRAGQAAAETGLHRLGVALMAGLAVLLLLAAAVVRCLLRRERDNPVAELKRALAAGEFIPFYQPVVDIRSGRLRGAEVLMRWRKSDGTILSPASFIPLAESSGLIVEMTRALMRRTCQEVGPMLGPRPYLTVGFNLAARHFADEEIVGDVRTIFSASRIPFRQVVLEVTERQPLENLTETRRVIAALQELGVRIAIDDVGTGHGGLSYMLKLGVDIIKIDKMFIDALGSERHSNTIVETLIDLAHDMRMDVIAEGVEQFEQVVHLRELGIRAAQGFVFSPPLPGAAFLQLVEALDPERTRRMPAAAGRPLPLGGLLHAATG